MRLFWRGKKKENNQVQENPLDKELAFSYENLCKTSREKIAETLSVMTKVHSDEFMKKLEESATKYTNFELAWLITDARIAQWSEAAEEKKKKLQARYDKCFITLYISWHSCSRYDAEVWFQKLQKDCIYAWNFTLAAKCQKVLEDIAKLGNELNYKSRQAALEGRPRWKEYWPSNSWPEDYWAEQ